MLASAEDDVVAAIVVYFLVILGIMLACGFGGRALMRGKGRSGAAGFCLGFFLGVPGLLIAGLLSPTPEYEAYKIRRQMELLGTSGGMTPGVSPVMSAAIAAANPARWADDPLGRHEQRYWDGSRWTEHVADRGVASVDDPSASRTPPTVALPVARATPAISPAPSAPATPAFSPAALPVYDVPDHGSTVPRQAARLVESIAELVFDSGGRVTVTTPLVIGRAPRRRDELPAAALFPVEDHTMSVSATHLLVGPHASGVWVEDTGSTNGTVVAHATGETQQLSPKVRVNVSFGSEIRFGERSLQVVPAAGG